MTDVDWTDPNADPVERAQALGWLNGRLHDVAAKQRLRDKPSDGWALIRDLTDMCERLSYMARTSGESNKEVRRHIMRTATHRDGSRVWSEVE